MVEKPLQFKGVCPVELIMSLKLQRPCDILIGTTGRNIYVPDELQLGPTEGRTHVVPIARPEDRQEDMGTLLVFRDISEPK